MTSLNMGSGWVCLPHDPKAILNSNGNPEVKNYSFKFKNTNKNDKEVIIDAGKENKLKLYNKKDDYLFKMIATWHLIQFFSIRIDFVPT